MIVFELQCGQRHRFEGWFASAEAFERQNVAGKIACPVCADLAILKVPSARIQRAKGASSERVASSTTESSGQPAKGQMPTKLAPGQQMTLAAFIDHVLVNSEDVGARFAEEARRIHRDEAPRRSIRGQSTPEETEALLEEGVPVFPLPIPPKDSWQ
ncbi:MAG: DUF1178 family protein [Burkholderiales bacterium]